MFIIPRTFFSSGSAAFCSPYLHALCLRVTFWQYLKLFKKNCYSAATGPASKYIPTCECLSEWKSGTSLALNRKPEMSKLSETGTADDKTNQKARLHGQTVGQS